MNALALRNIDTVVLVVNEDAKKLQATLLAEALSHDSVTDDFTLECAVETVRKIKEALHQVESLRKVIKAPLRTLEKTIDTEARAWGQPLLEQLDRIDGDINRYHREQQELKREAERKRREEEARQEAERRKADEEARRKDQEAIQQAKNAESKRAAETRARLDEQRRHREAEEARTAAALPVVTAPKIQGTAAKTYWLYEVTSLDALFKARPDLCRIEPDGEAIRKAIRADMRQCMGLKIWSEERIEVRR